MTDPHPPDPTSLLGRWDFTRTIDDRRTGIRSTVVGHTDLGAESDTHIRWHEEGVLRTAGRELDVYRTLHIVLRDGSWIVTFDDGRFFHPWSPGAPVEHPCGADRYRGRIDTVRETTCPTAPVESWTVQWTVTGPHKDYTATTVLTARRSGAPT